MVFVFLDFVFAIAAIVLTFIFAALKRVNYIDAMLFTAFIYTATVENWGILFHFPTWFKVITFLILMGVILWGFETKPAGFVLIAVPTIIYVTMLVYKIAPAGHKTGFTVVFAIVFSLLHIYGAFRLKEMFALD